MYKVSVLTISDKGSSGQRDDTSGPAIQDILSANPDFQVVDYKILPDDFDAISGELKNICDRQTAHLILTTGGTGFSERDVTPEATLAVVERRTPGIPEAMRAYSMTITPRAMLSRAEAGIRGRTLIVNLPGSPKAVKESLTYILPALAHGLEVLLAGSAECART
jgi:molybdenum cofactor synthesis domain-containing protein